MSGFKKLKALSLISVLALSFGACSQPAGSDKEEDPGFVPVTDITGVPTGGVKGTPIDLTVVSVVPSDAANKSIVWSIKDPGSTVLSRGVTGQIFTPNTAGNITITAIIVNGKGRGETFSKDFVLTITDNHVAVTDITRIPPTGTAGTAISLSGAAVVPANAVNKTILWSVAADSPVKGTVEGNSVTPKGAGNLKLTALVVNGKSPGEAFTKDFTLAVSGSAFIPVTNITGLPDSVEAGEAIDLSEARIVPANATNRSIVWAVAADSEVKAEINGNKVMPPPRRGGELKLTAKVVNGKAAGQDYTKTLIIDVEGVPVESVAIMDGEEDVTGQTITLTLEESKQLRAEISPTDAGNKNVNWTTGNADAVTVIDGEVRAVAAGEAVITVTTLNGGKTASVTVTVTYPSGIFDEENDNRLVSPASTLSEALEWIKENGADHGKYLIILSADEEVNETFQLGSLSGNSSTGDKKHLTITLKANEGVTLKKIGPGAMFKVKSSYAPAVDTPTLILDQGITLEGYEANTESLVQISMAGSQAAVFEMREGSRVTGNKSTGSRGAGVEVSGSSTFRMRGGRIDNNQAIPVTLSGGNGGGVYNEGTFEMTGGSIDHNTVGGKSVSFGGGVYSNGPFTMSGGSITYNKSEGTGTSVGGGISAGGDFNMSGDALIGYNTAKRGGGIYFSGVYKTFTMTGGSIEGNTAEMQGAGVYKSNNTFHKTGGVIYGIDAGDKSNKPAHAIQTGSGGAAGSYYDETAGPDMDINSESSTVLTVTPH